MSGMRMSMRTTSTSVARHRVTASTPLAAVPTTSMSSWAPRIIANPSRTSSWSSTTATRITPSARDVREGDLRLNREATLWSGTDPQRATAGLDALTHAPQTIAHRWPVWAELAVVLDVNVQASFGGSDLHPGGIHAGMSQHVGQRLLQQPVHGVV